MAPRYYIFIIIFMFFTGVTTLVLPFFKRRKWSSNLKFSMIVVGVLLIFYTLNTSMHLVHYNQVKNSDGFWLKVMFDEYVRINMSLPKTYSDLQKVDSNTPLLFEDAFYFKKPKIKFLIREKSNNKLRISFYELGYDEIDDELKSTITTPFSIFGLNIRGDFLITHYDIDLEDLKRN